MQNPSNPSSNKLDREMGTRLPLTILVAEDNIINQKVVTNLLNRLGYKADIVSNGLEVLEAVQKQTYDLILMDIQMPEMGGEEATQSIRKTLPADLQPRIVALTANAMKGDRERFLESGMNDYISKPINIEDLVRVLSISQPVRKNTTNPEHADTMTPSAQNAVDPAVLLEFESLMGEDAHEMVVDLVDLYINNSPMLIEQMRRQITAQRLPELQRAAHTLKGNSFQLGANALGDICFTMEKLAKSGSIDGAADLLVQIEQEFQRVKQELENRYLSGT